MGNHTGRRLKRERDHAFIRNVANLLRLLNSAWASQKSFRAKDGGDNEGDGGNFRGQKRSNVTHASITDPKSRLYRKAAAREAKLCYMGHVTMENRHGLAVAGTVTKADGTAERRASHREEDGWLGEWMQS
jgi:hypothetical protein